MLRKNKIFCFLFFIATFVSAQHLEVLNSSGFRHNYAVGKLAFVENVNDTSKLKYIATLRITAPNHHNKLYVSGWLDIIEPKAVEMGANTFCMEKYEEKDSISYLTVKVFFAGAKFIALNEQKINKNNIYLFSNLSYKNESVSFYFENQKKSFDSEKHYTISARTGENISIFFDANYFTNYVIEFGKAKSKFYYIPINKLPIKSTSAISQDKGTEIEIQGIL